MSKDEVFLGSDIPAGDIDFIIPAASTAKEFGNVNVRKRGDLFEIQLTLLLSPQGPMPRAWKTGVALDASASMKRAYGRFIEGHIPAHIYKEYEEKGWAKKEVCDGRRVITLQRPAVDDALGRGLVTSSPNHADYLAPEFISYLARQQDVDRAPIFIYWAGDDGNGVELVGNINESDCALLTIGGPAEMDFGKRTYLLPAVKFMVDRVKNSHMGLFVFITDGRIDDLQEVKRFTLDLAKEIITGQMEQIKCVLIGVGSEADEGQLIELEATGTPAGVSVWDHMMVSDFQDMMKIFTEIIRDARIVGKTGSIHDAQGKALRRFPAGVPTRLVFSMPVSSEWFELEIDGQRIKQLLKVPKYGLGG